VRSLFVLGFRPLLLLLGLNQLLGLHSDLRGGASFAARTLNLDGSGVRSPRGLLLLQLGRLSRLWSLLEEGCILITIILVLITIAEAVIVSVVVAAPALALHGLGLN
jgi:hypothetical protein